MPGEPPTPVEQPRVPCGTDDECKPLDPRAICAQFQGRRDCTIPCAQEQECDIPSLGGPKLDFMTCIPDEGETPNDHLIERWVNSDLRDGAIIASPTITSFVLESSGLNTSSIDRPTRNMTWRSGS